jgi:hypothetical protein
MQTMTDHQHVIEIAEAALVWIDDQTLLSQGHCVNVLLDLYCATDDFALRWAIAERLSDIRFLNAVDADDMRADLTAIVGIAGADVPSELEWARCALETCLRGDVGSRPSSYVWSAAA